MVLTGGEGGVEEHQGSIADPQDYLARPEMSPNGLATHVHGPTTATVRPMVLRWVVQLGRGAERGGGRRRR